MSKGIYREWYEDTKREANNDNAVGMLIMTFVGVVLVALSPVLIPFIALSEILKRVMKDHD